MKLNYLFISHQRNQNTQSTKKRRKIFVISSWYRFILHTFSCIWKFDVHLIFSVAYAHVGSPLLAIPLDYTINLSQWTCPSWHYHCLFLTFISRAPLSFLLIILLFFCHMHISLLTLASDVPMAASVNWLFWTTQRSCVIGIKSEILPYLNGMQYIKTSHHCQTVV